MTDASGAPPAAPIKVRIVQDIPLFYAEGVSGHSYGSGVSRFQLIRAEPDPEGGPPRPVYTDIVMPIEAFVQMWVFFEHRLKTMVNDGTVTRDQINRTRAHVQTLPGGSSEPL